MAVWALMLMAGVAGPPAPETAAPGACEADPQAITVCARRRASDQRLPALPAQPEQDGLLPPAQWSMFGGAAQGRVYTQQGSVGGFTSNRVMVGIKLPF